MKRDLRKIRGGLCSQETDCSDFSFRNGLVTYMRGVWIAESLKVLTSPEPAELQSQGGSVGIPPAKTVVQWPSHFHQCGTPLISNNFSSIPHWVDKDCQIHTIISELMLPNLDSSLFFFFLSFLCLFVFLGPHLQHIDVPRLGV